MTERVLAIDLSSKTGWAVGVSSPEGLVLEAHGQIEAIHEPTSEPYPGSYVLWAEQIFGHIFELIQKYKPDSLSIEETSSGSKNVYSQKILEYSQYLLAKHIRESGIKARYFLTGEWRQIIGCVMTKEEKIRNKAVREHNKTEEAVNGKVTKRARDKDGKAIGKIGKKHVNIRRVNEIFAEYLDEPLTKKREDECDALGLLAAYHMKRRFL